MSKEIAIQRTGQKDGRFKSFIKRITRTTYEPYSYDFEAYLTQATNPYNDQSTFREIYEGEPLVRGMIDTQANAIYGDYDFEFLREKVRPNETKAKETVEDWIYEPRVRFNQKLRSISVKLLLDNLVFLEVDPVAKNFYVLNKGNCEVTWNTDNTSMSGINWFKHNKGSTEVSLKDKEPTKHIPMEKLVIISYHDPDTDLWQSAPMRSIIAPCNILFHGREYNNDIFRASGVPSLAYIFKSGVSQDVFNKTKREANNIKNGKNLYFKGDVDIKQIGGFNKDMEYEKLMMSAFQDLMTALNSSPIMSNFINRAGGEDKNEYNSFSEKIHTYQSMVDDGVNDVIWKLFVKPTHDQATTAISKALHESDLDAVKLHKARRVENPYKKIRWHLRKWVDLRLLSAIQKIWIDTNVINPNEARKQIGMERYEGGDQYAFQLAETIADKATEAQAQRASGGAGSTGNSGGANTGREAQVKEPKVEPAKKSPSVADKLKGKDV